MKFLSVLTCLFLCFLTPKIYAIDYTGNKMLLVLGMKTSSPRFKEFCDYWKLDEQYVNRSRGIKLFINQATGIVQSFIIAGNNVGIGGTQFVKFSGALPFGITLDDNVSTLRNRLGPGRLIGKNAMKFNHDSITIEASFSEVPDGNISFLKFNRGDEKPIIIQAQKPATGERNKPMAETNPGKNKLKAVEKPKELSPFKLAILDVFKSSHESSLASIKAEPRTEGNFWKYKYTYNTSVKIPGEKYNMIYRFPFENSQLDFVAVIKEADVYDKSFEKEYNKFVKLLLDNFTPSEGWKSFCLPNPNKSKLAATEVQNDKYGAAILDYSTNPKGEHVLFLRFLLFSD